MFSESKKYVPPLEKKIDSQPENSVSEKSSVFKFEMFTDHEQRRLLGEAADELVEHVVVVEKQGLEDPKKRVVVFLDKSARPLSTIFREMWRLKRPKEVVPQVLFMNIGKEVVEQNNKRESGLPFENFDDKDKFFEEEDVVKIDKHSLVQEQANRYVSLKQLPKGSVVTVVDEIVNSRGTGRRSEKIFSEFFPDVVCDFYPLASVVHPFEYDEYFELDDAEKEKKLTNEHRRLLRHHRLFGGAGSAPWSSKYRQNVRAGLSGSIEPKHTHSLVADRYRPDDELSSQELLQDALDCARLLVSPEISDKIANTREYLKKITDTEVISGFFLPLLKKMNLVLSAQDESNVVQTIKELCTKHIQPYVQQLDQPLKMMEDLYAGLLSRNDVYEHSIRKVAPPGFNAYAIQLVNPAVEIFELQKEISSFISSKNQEYRFAQRLPQIERECNRALSDKKIPSPRRYVKKIIEFFSEFASKISSEIGGVGSLIYERQALVDQNKKFIRYIHGDEEIDDSYQVVDYWSFAGIVKKIKIPRQALRLREELKHVAREYWDEKSSKV